MSVTAPVFDPVPVRPVRASRLDSSWFLWIAIIAVLLFLVVSPFVYLVVTSFQAERTGEFTFANYAAAYGRARYVDALLNSLKLGAVSALLAGVFAVPLAWAVARTNMPGRGLTRMLVLATFITPPYTGAVAWILLAGPNAGWLNRFYMMATGAEAGPFNIYSFTGLAVVIVAGQGRVLIRASGTEPLLRVMVEAFDAAQASRCAEQLAEVARQS